MLLRCLKTFLFSRLACLGWLAASACFLSASASSASVDYSNLYGGKKTYDGDSSYVGSRMRQYVPEWGSFMGPDMNLANGPEGEPMGVGNYVGFYNKPLTQTDPMGLGNTTGGQCPKCNKVIGLPSDDANGCKCPRTESSSSSGSSTSTGRSSPMPSPETLFQFQQMTTPNNGMPVITSSGNNFGVAGYAMIEESRLGKGEQPDPTLKFFGEQFLLFGVGKAFETMSLVWRSRYLFTGAKMVSAGDRVAEVALVDAKVPSCVTKGECTLDACPQYAMACGTTRSVGVGSEIQVLLNQSQGALGEAAVRQRLLNSQTVELVGEQVRITTPGIGEYRVTDFLVRGRTTGKLWIIEVKTGEATRDAIQLAKDALIGDPFVSTTFTGSRATAAGFPSGTPTGPIRTFEVNASNFTH